ncbi:MAG TPA: protein phosphatase 2C domain-containing protein [Chloroflexota bacterium]|nr:protein phosphatase 2C domain-containing protein [Chloroflexota bacterium]
MSESGQDMAANAADVSGPRAPEEVASPAAHVPSGADAVEVSPPGHAPQGLAAEPDAHNAAPASSPTEVDATTRRAEDASQGLPAAAVSPPARSEAPPLAVPEHETAAPASAEEPPKAAVAPAVAAEAPEGAAHAEPRGPDTTGDRRQATGDSTTPPLPPDAYHPSPAQAPDLTVETPPGAETPCPAEVGAPAAHSAGGPPLLTPLEPGTVVGDRYTIVGVAQGAQAPGDTLVYRASDARSFERCWCCGSTDNGSSTRFCQNCGAPIQGHPVTLLETRGPTSEAEEVEQDGHYFHVQPERRRFGAEGVGIEIGAYCAEGPHHPNEDSYWYVTQTLCANSQRLSTAIVVFADGMGGYAPGSGLISARIAATVGKQIFGALETQAAPADALDSATAEAIVRQAIGAANTMVLDAIAHAGEMGSTLVVVLIHGDVAYVANIGDSRAYNVDPRGRATAITRDQSLVAQEVQQGHLAESDIYTAMGNNIILHAIGEEGVQDAADWYTQPLEPGSYLLVCSDGYWKTLRGGVVPEGGLSGNLSEQARRMVDTALTQGSDDNTTVVLVALS